MPINAAKKQHGRESVYYFPVRHAFGLDFSDASLKAVEIVRKGSKNILQAHSFLELPPNVIFRGEVKDAEALKRAIGELLKKARPKPITTKYVVTSFPEASVYLHPFEFPAALTEKQVIATIPFEAESELPIKLNEMYTDIRFHRGRENSHHVVFTAAPRVLVDSYMKILQEATLKPIVFELDSPALIRSLMRPNDDPVVILDIGAWSSTITIIEKDMVHGYVSVPIGGSHITQIIAETLKIPVAEAEKIKREKGVFAALGENGKIMEGQVYLLVSEITKAAKFHEQHTGRPVKQLIVSGGTALAADFIEYLRKNTGYEVVPGDPLATKELEYGGAYSAADKEDFAGRKEAFASTVGLAIRGNGVNIASVGLNLLPEDTRTQYEYWPYQLFFSACAVFFTAVIMGAMLYSIYFFVTILHRNALVNFEKRIFSDSFPADEFKRYKQETKAANQEINLLKSFDGVRQNLGGVAEDLTKNIPVGIQIQDITVTVPQKPKDSVTVEIKGVAAARAGILDFENKLRQRADVLKVDSPLANLDRAVNAPFSMTVKMNLPKDNYAPTNE